MPSGAKKRKAAKKKGSQPTNHSNPSPVSTLSHGDEDVKHHDDKGSDVGEVSSPASQDHHSHRNHFTEGGEEEIEKQRGASNLPPVEGLTTNGSKKPTFVEDSGVEVEREFKIEGESDKIDGIVEHDEASRKSYDGGSSGSSSGNSSDSDDETHCIKNNQAAGNNAPIVESVIKENGEKKPSPLEDEVSTSVAFMDGPSIEDAIIQPVENTAAVLDRTERVEQENDDRSTMPYNAPGTTADNGVEHEKGSGVAEPLLVPSQAPVQKTSWKSCCGLFEVFSGSGT